MKTTRFKQSIKNYTEYEQFYYDGARQMMLDNGGLGAIDSFMANEFEQIPESGALKITKEKFKEILLTAKQDYFDILFISANRDKRWIFEAN